MKANFIFPNDWNEEQKTSTKAWVTDLINDNQYNLKYLLTWYSLDTYTYKYVPNDPDELPNVHTFIFKPKCITPRYQLNPQDPDHQTILSYIYDELDQKPFMDNPFDESFKYYISPDLKTLTIILQATI